MTLEPKGYDTVPGINICDNNEWSKPQLLVDGNRQCDPVYAWCVGEDLHMLIADKISRHIVLEASSGRWKSAEAPPVVPSKYDFFVPSSNAAFRTVGGNLHIAYVVNDSVHYLAFKDGKWMPDLTVEGSDGFLNQVRMALNWKGNVYLGWSVRGPSPRPRRR